MVLRMQGIAEDMRQVSIGVGSVALLTVVAALLLQAYRLSPRERTPINLGEYLVEHVSSIPASRKIAFRELPGDGRWEALIPGQPSTVLDLNASGEPMVSSHLSLVHGFEATLLRRGVEALHDRGVIRNSGRLRWSWTGNAFVVSWDSMFEGGYVIHGTTTVVQDVNGRVIVH